MAKRSNRNRGRRSGGFTLLEMIVSTVVMTVLVQAVMQSALAMAGSAEFGQKRQRLVVLLQHALEKVSAEVADSSSDVDELGNPYITVGGTTNDQTISFRRIVNFGSTGAEIEPIWSSTITYHRVNAQFVRTQDGVDEVLLNGVAQIDCEVLANGRVNLTVGITAPQDGLAPTTIIRSETISTVY